MALDRCTGSFAIKLRAASVSMESSYKRVEVYRAAAIAACIPVATCPPALEALEFALMAEAGIEKAIKLYWIEQQQVWSKELSTRCELGFGIQKSKFPDFPYAIVTPEKGLAVDEGTLGLVKQPAPILLRVKKRNLSSEATVNRTPTRKWLVRWTG